MTAYCCPLCFITGSIIASIQIRNPCSLCGTISNNKLCSGCSQISEKCYKCGFFIQTGKDHAEDLDVLAKDFELKSKTNPMYSDYLVLCLTKRNQIIDCNRVEMLILCKIILKN